MARSTRLVILIKNIYTLCGRKRFLLPVKYFPTNLEYPFTLRVTGIKITCQSSKGTNLDQYNLISENIFSNKLLITAICKNVLKSSKDIDKVG